MAKVQYQGMGEAKEPELLVDDIHEIRIVKATHGPGKTDPNKFRTEVILDCPSVPDAQGIFHYISDRNPDGDPKSEAFKNLKNKQFFSHFGIPYDDDGYDLDDMLGKTAMTKTKLVVDDQGRKNVNLVLPELIE